MYPYLWDRLRHLEREIAILRRENEALKKKLASLQPITIERIEYKIQELSIETLSGTLNVGLSATGDGESIERILEKVQEKKKKKGSPPEKKGHPISIRDDSPAEKSGEATGIRIKAD